MFPSQSTHQPNHLSPLRWLRVSIFLLVLLPLGRGVKVLAGRPDLVRVSVAGQRPKVLGRIDQIAWVEVPLREGMAPP